MRKISFLSVILFVVMVVYTQSAELRVPGSYPTIQAAIDAANGGDIVIVSDGIYTGEGNKNLSWNGSVKHITVKSENGPENCIIDCGNSGRGFNLSNTSQNNGDIIMGFTIRNGKPAFLKFGGGILCENASPTITNCIIVGNKTDSGRGGGISCKNSSPIITNCTITENLGDVYGGGIFCQNSSPTINNCVIAGNRVNLYDGGGIYFLDCPSSTVTNCTIVQNSAPCYGGGISGFNYSSIITNSILWNNRASYGGSQIANKCGWDSVTVSYNDINGGKAGTFGSHIFWGNGNINSDPLFMNAYLRDYHLQKDSPCINVGDPYYLPSFSDLDGKSRVISYRVDMGAYEYAPIGHIVGWGDNRSGQTDVPEGNDFVAVASGAWHNLAIRVDGSLVAWGMNSFGSCSNVPEGNDFVAVDAGHYHSLALKSDGSLVSWGFNMGGAWQTPVGNDFVAISCGPYDNLALKSDGSLVSWGWNYELPEGNDFIAIAAGMSFNIALRSNGSLAAAGNNYLGQCDVPEGNDFIAIAAGPDYAIALKTDGSLVAWGNNDYGQCDVPEGNDFITVTAGEGFNIAIKSDGSIVAWGSNYSGQCNVPEGNDFVAIAAGMWHGVAVRTNYVPVADAGEDQTVYANIDGMAEVTLDGSGSYDEDGDELTYLWLSTIDDNDTTIAIGVNPTIELPVGEHTIKLIVNDGIVDSESNEVVINVVGAMKISLQVNPQVIHRNSNEDEGRIMTWMQMPEDITRDQIDESTLLKMYPGDISAITQQIIQYEGQETQQIRIHAFFSKDELLYAVPEDGSIELKVVGKLKTGQYFYGTDTVDIRNQNPKNGKGKK